MLFAVLFRSVYFTTTRWAIHYRHPQLQLSDVPDTEFRYAEKIKEAIPDFEDELKRKLEN